MRVTPETAVSATEWNDLLSADPSSTFFHELAWIGSLDAAYPYYQPLHFIARDDAGRLLGGLPAIRSVRSGLVQLFSLPYGTYGHPLCRVSDEGERLRVRNALIEAFVRAAREPRVVRAQLVLFDTHEPLDGYPPPAWRRAEETHIVDLAPDFEAVWAKFEGDKRTSSRKAAHAGVVFEDATTHAGANVLEQLYHVQAREWTDHTPVPGRLLHELVDRAPDQVTIGIGRLDGSPLAAQLVLYHKQSAVNWLTCSTPEGRQHGAATFLYKVATEEAVRRGCTTFDLGGSGGREALSRYKSGFGSRVRPYSSYLHESAWFRPLHRIQYRLRGIRVES
jgi:hypothetical protein